VERCPCSVANILVKIRILLFSSVTLKTATKNYFYFYYFLKVHWHHFPKIKEGSGSGTKPDPNPYLVLTGLDPGGPKTYGSGSQHLHNLSVTRPLFAVGNCLYIFWWHGGFSNVFTIFFAYSHFDLYHPVCTLFNTVFIGRRSEFIVSQGWVVFKLGNIANSH
jgi:hypothetical protein